MAASTPPAKPSDDGSTLTVEPPMLSTNRVALFSSNETLENPLESSLKRKARPQVSVIVSAILELPEGVLCLIMSLQAHRDRLSLAVTCNDVLKKVEAFCERKWKEIRANADETWEARLRDTSSIKTEISEHLILPNRYLLSKAYAIHLYTLGGLGESAALSLDALTDGETILFTDNNGCRQVWDSSTRRHIANIEIPEGQEVWDEQYRALICGERIVVTADGDLRVWTFAGDFVHHIAPPEGLEYIKAETVGKDKVFFTYCKNRDSISCLDLATGVVQDKVITWERGFSARHFHMLVVDGMLLVLRGGASYIHTESDDERDPAADGIYVFDLKDCSQSDFVSGDYTTFPKHSINPGATVVTRTSSIGVFTLSNGCLARIASFANSRAPFFCSSDPEVLLANKSRVYLRGGDCFADDKRVEVYSAHTGELLHTFNLPACAYPVNASTNGRELFLGTSDFSGYCTPSAEDGGPSVRAYCLNGH